MDTDQENTAVAAPEDPAGKKITGWCVFIGAMVLLADQLSKIWIMQNYALHETTPVIDGFFSITYVRNPGAAWGIFAGYSWLLLCVALAVIVLMFRFYRFLCAGFAERELSLFLILSGVIGNSIDRLWHGMVIDFLDFHYKNVWNYPVFNIADIAICVGVGLFLLSDIFRPDRKKEK